MAIGGGYWDMLRAGPGWQDLAQAVQSGLARRDRRQMSEIEAQQAAEANRAKLEQFRAQQAAQAQEADQKRRANVQWVVGNRLARDPSEQTLEWARKTLEENNAAEGFDLSQYTQTFEPSPDAPGGEIRRQIPRSQQDIAGVAESMRVKSQGVLGPQRDEQEEREPLDDIAKRVRFKFGLKPNQAGFAEAYRKEFELEEKGKMERASAGAARINVGQDSSKATQGVTGEQQNALIAARQTRGMLQDLENMATDPATGQVSFAPFLGAKEQAGAWTLNKLDKLAPFMVSDDQRQWLDGMNQFRATLDKYRSEEYKRLLGSAQSEAEIKNLVNAVISSDMSSSQFNSAFKALKRATERNERIAEEVLGQGFVVGSQEYKTRFSQREQELRARERQARISPEKLAKVNEHIKAARTRQEGIAAAVAAEDISQEEANDLLSRL